GTVVGIPRPRSPESGLMSPAMLPPPRGAASAAILRVFGARPFHTDGEILALAFAADAGLWSVEEPGVLRRWDRTTRPQTPWPDLGEPATLWAFGPGATRVAAASDEVSLWDVAAGERVTAWPAPSWVTALAFPPAGGLIATGHDDATVRLWDVAR